MVNPCCSSQPAPTQDAHPQAPGQPERILKTKETNRVWTSRQLPKTAKWAGSRGSTGGLGGQFWRKQMMESFMCKAIFIYMYVIYLYKIYITFRESINDVCNTSKKYPGLCSKQMFGRLSDSTIAQNRITSLSLRWVIGCLSCLNSPRNSAGTFWFTQNEVATRFSVEFKVAVCWSFLFGLFWEFIN